MKKYVATLLALVLIVCFSVQAFAATDNISATTSTIPTSGGNRNVTWIEIDLNAGYEITAMSAQDTFGRASATLSEFAAAAGTYPDVTTVIFPVNFFITQTHEIVGGIVSQGRVVSAQPQPWLNWGIGFDENNTMSLFDGRINGDYIYGEAWNAPRLPYITAFNVYPHLIRDGQRLPVREIPGATMEWQNARTRRSFMGQRADGTFIVGTVDGTNVLELQDIAMYLGLVTATNIDGGASASIWLNGEYVLRPGRELASVMVITGGNDVPEPTPTPVPAPSPAPAPVPQPDGVRVLRFEIGSTTYIDNGIYYTLESAPFLAEGRTMVPLRVIAEALGAEDIGLDNNIVSFTLNGTAFELPIDQPLPNSLGTPVIVEGRTFIPLAFILNEIPGATPRWDGANRAAYVYIEI